MNAIVQPDRNVMIAVRPACDGAGFVVEAVLDERTAEVPAGSLAEAVEVADSLRKMVTMGMAESFFND